MIQLYIRNGCPYCEKVTTAARKMGLTPGKDYELIDASPSTPGNDMVIKVGGKEMVPFIIDGEISMYESDDIIAYMRDKLSQQG